VAKLHLVLANKNYSSWSLRVWLAMAAMGLRFEETIIPLDTPRTAGQIRKHSGAGRLPVLHHGDIVIWESLAILEYLAEIYPDKPFWPRNREARATARAVANEMHAGFTALRNFCPMNLRRPKRPPPSPFSDEFMADLKRVETIWSDCRKRHGRGGPFLFGRFSIADSMYAPVATRIDTYAINVSPTSRDYIEAIVAHPAFQLWKKAALEEKWIVPTDEVD
jgi:glutathione S-transferase